MGLEMKFGIYFYEPPYFLIMQDKSDFCVHAKKQSAPDLQSIIRKDVISSLTI